MSPSRRAPPPMPHPRCAPSGPPACAMSGRPPPPLPPTAADAARTSSTALNRPVRSCDTPTTMLALPSFVDTSATTPVPSCLPIASASPFRSRAGTSPRLRAASLTPFTSSTSDALPPVASLRCSSATWRSSFRLFSSSAATRSGASAGLARNAPATSFSRCCVSSTTASAIRAGHRLDATHAGGNRALRQDLEIADIAGAPHMRAAAQLDGIRRLVAFSADPSRRRAPPRRTFSPNSAIAPISTAASGVISRVVTSVFSRMRAFTSASTQAISSPVNGRGCETSKRSRSGAFRLPFCATCVPSRRRSASCSRCVAE